MSYKDKPYTLDAVMSYKDEHYTPDVVSLSCALDQIRLMRVRDDPYTVMLL